MSELESILQKSVAGVSVQAMLVALLAIVAGFTLARIAESMLRRVAEKTPPQSMRRAILGAFDRPIAWMLRVGGIWLALNAMPLAKVEAFALDRFVFDLLQAATIVLTTWLGMRVVDAVAAVFAKRVGATEGTYDDQLVPIFRTTGKVFLVVIGGVMVLQNLGYSVSSLLAGVGIGGAALAFASKDTVANFFGSLVVFIDRPFVIGDWIEVGDVEGTVEVVGVRVTQLRTSSNTLITVPNARFTTLPINNWSRMKKRRLKVTVALTYDSSPEKLRQAVEAIREIIRTDDRLDPEFYLVNFFELGPSSLDILCYLFTRTTSWSDHLQIREEFLLKIMEAMAKLGLSFAFPTQTVHVARDAPAAPPTSAGFGQLQGAPRAMERDKPL